MNIKHLRLIISIILISSSLLGQESDLIPYHYQNKWGFINQENVIIIPAQFDSVYVFQDQLAKIKLKNKYGVLNNKGHYILKAKYHNIERSFKDNLLITKKKFNSRPKCFNWTGEKAECAFSVGCGSITRSKNYPVGREINLKKKEKFALVYLNKSYDVWPIPKSCLDTTDYIYSSVSFYGQNLQLIKEDSLFGIFDPSKVNPKILCDMQELTQQEEYHDGINSNLNKYKINDKWGIINYEGERVTNAIYKEILFSEDKNLVLVKTFENKYFYVDKKGIEYIANQ